MENNLSRRTATVRGLSLIELLIAVTIIGILGSIAVTNYGDAFTKTERVVSIDFVEQLNNALKEFEQTGWELSVTADNDDVVEENQILDLLQTKDVTVFGSPHFRADWDPVSSDDNQKYRIRWNGATFELIEPGTDGNGLWYDAAGSNFAPPAP